MKTHNVSFVAKNTKTLTISVGKREWGRVVSDEYFSYSSMKTYVVGTH